MKTEILYSPSTRFLAEVSGELTTIKRLNERYKVVNVFSGDFGGRASFNWKDRTIYLPESARGACDWTGFFVEHYHELADLTKLYWSPSTSQFLWSDGRESWLAVVNENENAICELKQRDGITTIEMMHRSNVHDWVERPWAFWQDRTATLDKEDQ